MKKIILKGSLAAFICTLCINANAQQVLATPSQPVVKTFIITTETAKNLPEGVAYVNNKVTAKPGFKFELSSDRKLIYLKNKNREATATFTCSCGELAGDCGIDYAHPNDPMSQEIICTGANCCSVVIRIPPSPNKNISIKKNNAIKTNGQTETKQ
jgi:hypothetical protein